MLGKLEEAVMLGVSQSGATATAANVFQTLDDCGAKASFGAVFTTLDRLAEKKFLKASRKLIETGSGKKERTIYEITGLGARTLRESLSVTNALAAKSGLVVA